MKYPLALLLLLLSILPVKAAQLPEWVDSEAAVLFAKAALIEWSNRSDLAIERERLDVMPLVQARAARTGDRVVQVLYRSTVGSYVVLLLVNKDGYLEVFGRSATIDPPETLFARFEDDAFDPSSLLEEG